VVHRDVKPDNILLHEGRATIGDFGIAVAVERAAENRPTRTGVAVGTAWYMSPEQALGTGQVDGATDIYALGCVAFELLAGRPPFDGPNDVAVLFKHAYEEPPALSALRAGLPGPVDHVLARALAKAPGDRFSRAGEFAAALTRAAAGEPVALPPRPPAPPTPWPRTRRVRGTARAIGAALVTMLGPTPDVHFGMHAADGPATGEPSWLLVSDFVGPSGDPAIARVVRDLVTAEINQSRAVRTLSREQVRGALRAAGRPDTAAVGVELARELAYRSAVRVVLGGEIVAAGQAGAPRYTVALRVVGVEDGREYVTVADRASDVELLPKVQRLARRVREQLGEQPAIVAANRPALETMTPSEPAYRKYVAGITLKERGNVAASTESYREAVQLDTGFASAWAALGMNYVDARQMDSARWAIGEALRRPNRLSEAQLYRLRADSAYILDHDLDAAVRWYDRFLLEVPHSVGGRNNRGFYLSLLGRYEEAVQEFARAVRDNPLDRAWSQMPLLNEVACLVAVGQQERAATRAHALEGPFAQYAAIHLTAARDDWATADSLAESPATSPSAPAWLRIEAITTRAAASAARGAVGSADALLARVADTERGAYRRWYEQARVLLALAARDGGTPPGVPPHSRVEHRDTTAGADLLAGLRAAAAGDTAAARRTLAALERRPPAVLRRLGYGPDAIRALVASHAGAWPEAVRALTPAARDGEHDATELDRVSSVLLRWIVADAYARQGRLDSAITYLELALSPRRLPPGHVPLRGFVYPFAERRLARWYAQRGDTAAARAHERAFRAVFTAPDDALRPLLVDDARVAVAPRRPPQTAAVR
jgi:serine/threonine-protein kinase